MRPRLLTPFVAALAGSALLLLAMFVWVGMRGTSSQVALLEPSVAQAGAPVTSNGVTVAVVGNPNPAMLGQKVTFSVTVDITPGTPYDLVLDYGDGHSTTMHETFAHTSTNPLHRTHLYTTALTYNATAMLMTTDGMSTTVTASEQVVVQGPSVKLTAPVDPLLGRNFTYEVTVMNYDPMLVGRVDVSFAAGKVTESFDASDFRVDTTTHTAVATDTYVFKRSGPFTATATISPPAGSVYEVTGMDTVMGNAQAGVMLVSAPPATAKEGQTVVFTAELNVDPGAQVGAMYFFNFGDGTQPVSMTTDTGMASVQHTYASATGSPYAPNVVVYLGGVYAGERLVSPPMSFIVTPAVPPTQGTLTLMVGAAEITAGPPGIAGTTTVTAQLKDNNNAPWAGETLVLTIVEPTRGARFISGTPISASTTLMGQTDANGILSATLRASISTGAVTVTATGPGGLGAMATLNNVLPPGFRSDDVDKGGTSDYSDEITGKNGKIKHIRTHIPAGLATGCPAGEPDVVHVVRGPWDEQEFDETSDGHVVLGTFVQFIYNCRYDEIKNYSEPVGDDIDFEATLYGPSTSSALATLQQSARREVVSGTVKVQEQVSGNQFQDIPAPGSSQTSVSQTSVSANLVQNGVNAVVGQAVRNVYLPMIVR